MEKALHSLYGRSFVREDHLTGRLLIGHGERTTGDGIEMGQSEEEGLNGEHKKKDEGEEENKGTAPSVSYRLEKGMALSLFGCFLSLQIYELLPFFFKDVSAFKYASALFNLSGR